MITTPDKILKELSLIQEIFNIQFSKFNTESWFPRIFDDNNSPIDGRYAVNIDILSETKIFEIQKYKAELTQRYETSTNTNLLITQLLKIRDKASEIRDFYNNNLTSKSEIVLKLTEEHNRLNSEQSRYEFTKLHNVLILVQAEIISPLAYYGFTHLDVSKVPYPLIDKYKECYISDNTMLASYCQSFIDFVEDICNNGSSQYTKSNILNLKLDEGDNKNSHIRFNGLVYNGDLNRLFEGLINNKIIDSKTSKECFLFVFGGANKPMNFYPINWLASLALLGYFIDRCTDEQHVWEKTRANFLVNKVEVNINSIKNAVSRLNSDYANKPMKSDIIDTLLLQ